MSKDGRDWATVILMKFSHFDRTALNLMSSFNKNLCKLCCLEVDKNTFFQNQSFGSFIATFFDYLPCFFLSLVFRLFSLAVLMSYLQEWTLAIVFVYFILNMFICMKYSRRGYETSSVVLAFMSIFIPVFYIKKMDGLDMNKIDNRVRFLFLQYR